MLIFKKFHASGENRQTSASRSWTMGYQHCYPRLVALSPLLSSLLSPLSWPLSSSPLLLAALHYVSVGRRDYYRSPALRRPRYSRLKTNGRKDAVSPMSPITGVPIIACLTGLLNSMNEKRTPPEKEKRKAKPRDVGDRCNIAPCLRIGGTTGINQICNVQKALRCHCRSRHLREKEERKERKGEKGTDVHGDRNEVGSKWISSGKIGSSKEGPLHRRRSKII